MSVIKQSVWVMNRVFLVISLMTIASLSGRAETTVVVVPLAGQEITIGSAGRVERDTPPASNFQINSGLVTDLTTDLVWQQQRSSGVMEWREANLYCANLEVVTPTGTVNDWRLPTLQEWITILRFGTSQLLDSSVFPNSSLTYWTVSFSASDVAPGSPTPTSRWAISIDGSHLEGIFGRTSLFETRNEHHVRCVRADYD